MITFSTLHNSLQEHLSVLNMQNKRMENQKSKINTAILTSLEIQEENTLILWDKMNHLESSVIAAQFETLTCFDFKKSLVKLKSDLISAKAFNTEDEIKNQSILLGRINNSLYEDKNKLDKLVAKKEENDKKTAQINLNDFKAKEIIKKLKLLNLNWDQAQNISSLQSLFSNEKKYLKTIVEAYKELTNHNPKESMQEAYKHSKANIENHEAIFELKEEIRSGNIRLKAQSEKVENIKSKVELYRAVSDERILKTQLKKLVLEHFYSINHCENLMSLEMHTKSNEIKSIYSNIITSTIKVELMICINELYRKIFNGRDAHSNKISEIQSSISKYTSYENEKRHKSFNLDTSDLEKESKKMNSIIDKVIALYPHWVRVLESFEYDQKKYKGSAIQIMEEIAQEMANYNLAFSKVILDKDKLSLSNPQNINPLDNVILSQCYSKKSYSNSNNSSYNSSISALTTSTTIATTVAIMNIM